LLPICEFNFEPIGVNSTAPGGACTFRTFDDIGTFILNRVDVPRRLSGHWHAVRQDLPQARFGVRRPGQDQTGQCLPLLYRAASLRYRVPLKLASHRST
jgi:hypothetical protein